MSPHVACWFLIFCSGASATHAATTREVEACDPAVSPGGSIRRHVVVTVDKTFEPTQEARQWFSSAVNSLADLDDTMVQIASFSQSAGGNASPVIGPPLFSGHASLDSDRLYQRRTELAREQKCLAERRTQMHAQLNDQLQRLIGKEVRSASFTEIAASFQITGRAFAGVSAQQDLFVVLSDGLEHNPDQSFYANRRPRLINPEVELERLKKRGIHPALTHAEVIWIGLGTAKAILPWREYHALETYWNQAIRLLGGHPLELETVPAQPLNTLLQRPIETQHPVEVIDSVQSREANGPG